MAYSRSFEEISGPLQPVCRHLRSKSIYVAGELEPPADLDDAGTSHCWCNHTQHLMGPDNQMVDRRDCNANRSCYEGSL